MMTEEKQKKILDLSKINELNDEGYPVIKIGEGLPFPRIERKEGFVYIDNKPVIMTGPWNVKNPEDYDEIIYPEE